MTDETNTNDETNTFDVAACGQKAVQAWKMGDRATGKGDSLAVFALLHAWHTTLFTATIKASKKGDADEQDTFDLPDHYRNEGCVNENGTKNVKLIAARTKAVSEKVFGIADPDNALKMRISRSLDIVFNLYRLGVDETDITLNAKDQLQVPYTVMNDEPKADASDNEKENFEAMRTRKVTLDGTHKNSMAELGRRVKPAQTRNKGDSGSPDKGQALLASTKFVAATVATFITGDIADDMPAPNETLRKEMHALFLSLGQYFAADPVDEHAEDRKIAH